MNAKRLAFLLACLALTAPACTTKGVPVGAPTPPPPTGFINLLDPEHAPHWKETRDRQGIFEIQDGVLRIPGSYGFLKYVGYMGEEFTDFQLHLEFKLSRNANSGVILRGQPDAPHAKAVEIQILDSHGKHPTSHTCGAVYDVVTPMFEITRPAGEWNSYDITFQARHLIVIENGWKVIDTDLSQMTMPIGKFDIPYADLPLKGFLFLQDHHHEVSYRNILIRKL